MAQTEAEERSRRSLERRLRMSGIKSFKPMADFEWSWPSKVERDVIERALTRDFLGEARNLILVGRNGLDAYETGWKINCRFLKQRYQGQ